MREYLEFLVYLAIILIIIAVLMSIIYKNHSSIELDKTTDKIDNKIDKITDKIDKITGKLSRKFSPIFLFILASVFFILIAIISTFHLMELIKSYVPLLNNNAVVIYIIVFSLTSLIYILTFQFLTSYFLKRCSILFLNILNTFVELVGTFFLGLIVFTSLGSTSNDCDIVSLSNNFIVTSYLLSFIAITHYYTNDIISSKSDTKIKDEIAVSIEELTVESHNNRFVELEKQIEELKREQQAIDIKIAKPKGFVEKLIAILQIISSK